METKIKNFFRKGKIKRYLVFILLLAIFSGTAFLFASVPAVNAYGPCTTAKPCFEYQTGMSLKITHAEPDNKNGQYHFAAETTGLTGKLADDLTPYFTYVWTLTDSNGKGTQLSESNAQNDTDFDDPLTNFTPDTYQVTVVATVMPGLFKTQVGGGAGITDGYQLTQQQSGLAVANGSTQGDKVSIISTTQNSSNPLTFQLLAELDDASGNVIMGGKSNKQPSQNTWSWNWQYAPVVASGSGAWSPISANGFSEPFTFPSLGQYYLKATVTNTSDSNASAISSSVVTVDTTKIDGGLNSSNTNSPLSISCTQTSGLNYQCMDTNNSNHTGVSYDWNLNGKDMSTATTMNGYSEPLTFIAGANTVSATYSQSGSGNFKNTKTYTVDASGNITATNGNSAGSGSSDSCTGGISGITCIVARVIGALMETATNILAWLTAHLLVPIIVMVINIQPHTAAFSAVIVQEWVFIRNICNIFFIAAMIILGMSTILRLNGYDWHKTIPSLVIAALTVNFSLAFSQAIIGVADVAQAQFLGVCQTGSVTTCQSAIVIDNLAYQLMTAPLNHLSSVSASTFSTLAVALFSDGLYLLVAIVALFALVALAAFLVLRIVALWLLLMTSPAGYVLGMFPIKGLNKYSSMWWSNFWKYTFLTPILALALHICALLATTQAAFVAGSINSGASAMGGVGTFQTVATDVLSAILVTACLGMAISTAAGMSGAGGAMIAKQFGSYKDKVLGAPQRWAGAGAKVTGDFAKDSFQKGRQTLGGKLAFDANGNSRGLAGRMANFALNPKEGMAAVRSGWDAKTKTSKELAEARASRLQTLRKTGFDNKADVAVLQKKEDARMEKYMRMDPTKWREAFNKINDTSEGKQEKLAALSAAAKSGVLKKDADARFGGSATPEQLAQHIAEAVPAGANTAFFYDKLNEIGKEKNDLSLVGLDLDAGKNYADRTEMFQARATVVQNMDAGDIAKIKPDNIDNKQVADAVMSRVSTAPSDQVADKLSSKQLNKLGAYSNGTGVNHAAAAVGKMSTAAVLKIDLKDITNTDANEAVQEAVVSAAHGDKDVANKASGKLLSNMSVKNRVGMINSMTSSDAISKLDVTQLSHSPVGPITEQESTDLKTSVATQLQSHKDAINKTNNEVLKMVVDSIPKTDTDTINQINKKIGVKPQVTIPTPTSTPTPAPVVPPVVAQAHTPTPTSAPVLPPSNIVIPSTPGFGKGSKTTFTP